MHPSTWYWRLTTSPLINRGAYENARPHWQTPSMGGGDPSRPAGRPHRHVRLLIGTTGLVMSARRGSSRSTIGRDTSPVAVVARQVMRVPVLALNAESRVPLWSESDLCPHRSQNPSG